MTTVTYNIKLNMTAESKAFWLAYLSEAAQAYDECAMYIRDHNLPLNIQIIHENVYDWMRSKFPRIPAQGIIKTYKDVLGAFRSIRKNKHKVNKCPHKQGLNMHVDKRLYSNLTKEGICLTGEVRNKRTFYAFETYPKVLEMFSKYKTCDPLLFARNDEIYLSVPFDVPELPVQNNSCIGVDLGIKRLFVTSEGKYFQDKEFLAKKRKVRYLKRKLKSCGTKSAKRHLKNLKHKERNMNKSEMYKAVSALLNSTSTSTLVLEDLKGIKQKTKKGKSGYKRKKHNNMFSQVGIAEFRRILTYKAQLVGKQVETVNPVYTSQTDSRTGKRDGERHGCRYICKDGLILDADWNAAVNIGQKSKHPVLSHCPKDGAMQPLIGRAQSTAQSWNCGA